MIRTKINLTEGPVAPAILKMAGGMLFGFVAMSAFNAVDTYFVGQLGAAELAAMSFTFPVVMVIHSVSMGLGIGISSVVSRAIGSKDHNKVQRLTTDGLGLAVLIVLVISLCGLATIRPLFELLGARGAVLDLVQDYMVIWYIGVTFVVVPMSGNNAIRATGDTLTPSVIMIVAVVVNIILDPLLIFGMGPFPRMGIAGAALATVIARFSTLIFSLLILIFREKLILLKRPKIFEVLSSWKEITFIGVPAALVQAINPLSLGIITWLLAQFGNNVVAGFGAASRLEMLIMIIPMSFGSVMSPFTGQNWGAGKIKRIIQGVRFSSLISIIWGVVVFIGILFMAAPIISLFNDNPEIVNAGATYLRIISISYGFFGIMFISTQSFNAMKKPLQAAIITLLRAFIIYIPLAFIGVYFWQEKGIFTATMITNLAAGAIGFFYLRNNLKRKKELS
ncbi:MAG: MATE family efflux transporter [Spirochaetales bacterium]|nr:MATE family efflux transporter [Spirochaetales bacterium]